MHFLMQRGNLFLAGVVAEHHESRVAGDHVHEKTCQESHDEQRDDQRADAFQYKFTHPNLLPCGILLLRNAAGGYDCL